jgi:teichuronic acid biosynthesis glycosyltransferase TuaC
VHVLLIPSWYATTDNPVRGSFFREQAHALSRAGHRVGVIAPALRSVREAAAGLAGQARGIRFEDDEGVATYHLEGAQLLPGLKPANDRRWLATGRRLYERYVAEQGAPDLVHAHAVFMAGLVGADIKQATGVPLVVTEHSTVYERRAIPRFQVEEARAALTEADARLVVSPQLGESMERVLGPAAAPWEWVPNVVDSSFLDGQLRHRDAGMPFRFLSVAFLHEKKGHAALLEAFAARFAGDPGVELHLGGDGPERKRLHEAVRALGIAEQVRWLGALDREGVGAAMRNADAFVLASRLETFGVVLIEALATGLPVVATSSGGPECIVTPEDGILVPVGDLDALGDALERMLATAGRYDPESLRARCAKRFGEAALVQRLEWIYERVLANKPAGTAT